MRGSPEMKIRMKIRAIETIRIEERPNLLWVEVHTDEGITGLGETFYLSRTSRNTSTNMSRPG